MKKPGRSYWERELYNQVYDLVVVGAGLTGQSLALFFKRKHPEANVLVVDRGFYPLGASTRNAGFACFGSVTEHVSDMQIEDEAKIIDRIRRRHEGLNLLRETLGDANIQYEEPGGYEIFTDEASYQQAVANIDLCNSWLEKATGVRNVYHATKYEGYPAIKIEMEGALHPGKMVNTLYIKNLKEGVKFRWQNKVKSIDTEEAIVRLEGGITLESKHIAVATNSFTPELMQDVNIEAGRGYVFVTKPVTNLRWKGTFHYDRGYYYFRNIGEDRLLLGGARSIDIEKETTRDFGVNQKVKEHLMEFANDILSLPESWEIEQEWSGIMGFTETKSPVLKKIGSSSLIVAGLSGMGVALGMQLGKEGAGIISNWL
ncbi:MAG: FAD-binding oxidoreductase [Balneolaceae bacterium]|nr:FAD-binding oxidoreductase [Balneolaceae bacterium]